MKEKKSFEFSYRRWHEKTNRKLLLNAYPAWASRIMDIISPLNLIIFFAVYASTAVIVLFSFYGLRSFNLLMYPWFAVLSLFYFAGYLLAVFWFLFVYPFPFRGDYPKEGEAISISKALLAVSSAKEDFRLNLYGFLKTLAVLLLLYPAIPIYSHFYQQFLEDKPYSQLSKTTFYLGCFLVEYHDKGIPFEWNANSGLPEEMAIYEDENFVKKLLNFEGDESDIEYGEIRRQAYRMAVADFGPSIVQKFHVLINTLSLVPFKQVPKPFLSLLFLVSTIISFSMASFHKTLSLASNGNVLVRMFYFSMAFVPPIAFLLLPDSGFPATVILAIGLGIFIISLVFFAFKNKPRAFYLAFNLHPMVIPSLAVLLSPVVLGQKLVEGPVILIATALINLAFCLGASFLYWKTLNQVLFQPRQAG